MNLPGYDVLDKIGDGPAGTVWKAQQVSLDRVVAIRTLSPSLQSDPKQFEQILNQLRSAAHLTHPNIIKIFNVDSVQDSHFIVMEYVHGPSLAELIAEKGALPPKTAIRIALSIAEALRDAWAQVNIIHGDIRPANIIMEDGKTVKLTDLGMTIDISPKELAEQIDADALTRQPHYMAPEHLDSTETKTMQADMYSLGALLYHMLTGHRPFVENDTNDVITMHRDGTLPDPRKLRSSIPLPALHLMHRLLAKSPRNRYKDWPQLVTEIGGIAAGKFILGKQGETFKSTLPPIVGRNTSASAKSKTKSRYIAPNKSAPLAVHVCLFAVLLVWLVVFAMVRVRSVQAAHSTGARTPRSQSY